jgi:hypothetical protein
MSIRQEMVLTWGKVRSSALESGLLALDTSIGTDDTWLIVSRNAPAARCSPWPCADTVVEVLCNNEAFSRQRFALQGNPYLSRQAIFLAHPHFSCPFVISL